MTCLEKLKLEHPDLIDDTCWGGTSTCMKNFVCSYLPPPDCCSGNRLLPSPENCAACWNREIPEEKDCPFCDPKKIAEAIRHIEEGKISMNEMRELMGLPRILDSGNRREFESGAVRDIQEGKGRCDLLPLDVINDFYADMHFNSDKPIRHSNIMFIHINNFEDSGDVHYLRRALAMFTNTHFGESAETMLLEVSIHFEEGAKKYGDRNWQKGIPVRCYIDSAVRHYLKFLRGDKDEPHDRAFCWNILCAIWTCKHMPESNEYGKEEE